MLANAFFSLILLSASTLVQAAPQDVTKREPAPLTIPLIARAGMERRDLSIAEWADLANRIKGKYGVAPAASNKRALVTVSTTNQASDTSYYAAVKIGSRNQTLPIILDTGSADLWISGVSCSRCASASSGPLFDPTSSTSFRTSSGSLSISYGSGQVRGTLGTDTVSLGGFQVSDQLLGVATTVTNNFLNGNISGLMGLGFQSLASTGAVPWWIKASTAWSSPQMSFYLTRFRDTNNGQTEQPGGQFTMGGTNSSLYDGTINYISLVKAQYWTVPMTSIALSGGNTITLSGANQNAVVDTGTTLIGGPESVLASFYSQIPGSARGTQLDSSLEDYYVIPCDTNVEVSLTFGGQAYTMQASDLIGGTVSQSYCLGAFFVMNLSSGSQPVPGSSSQVPTWIVGSAFLKNVYTVFQSNPTAVGFARLKSGVQGFGTLGLAGFSIDENGNSTGTIVISSGSQPHVSRWIVLSGILATGLALLGM